MTAIASGDYKLFDGIETVNILKASGDAWPVNFALRRAMTITDIASVGLDAQAVVAGWSIPVEELLNSAEKPDAKIVRGDKIEANDSNWIVLRADLVTLRTRYRCLCVEAREDS